MLREIKRNKNDFCIYLADYVDFKYKQKQKYMFISKKYSKFEQLFSKYYDKRCHGVEITYNKIITKNLNIKFPSCR